MWSALFLICGVNCILQEKPILSPGFIDVLQNRSLEMTCSAHITEELQLESQWGILNQPGIFSDLIFVKEGKCKTAGFLAETKYYETKCYSNATFKVRIKQVNISNHAQEWYCSSNFMRSNTVNIVVQVPIKNVRMQNTPGDVLDTIEKIKTTLCCETSEGRPAANISWTIISKHGKRTEITNDGMYNVSIVETLTERNLIKVKSLIDIEPVRDDNGTRIICEATNRKEYVVRKEITIHVQYPPSRPVFIVKERILNDKICLIPGNNISVLCKSESYPFPTYLWNSARSTINDQYLNLTNITKNETFQCTATNNMFKPNQEKVHGTNNDKLKLHVLYPATKPVLSLKKRNNTLNETLYVLRDDDVTLLCHSFGDPTPKCQWDGQNPGSSLFITSIQTHTNKTCIASNKIQQTFGDIQTFSSKTSVKIVVSHPPGKPYLHFIEQNKLAKNGTYLTNKVIVEETSSFIALCKADGYPLPTCTWTLDGQKKLNSHTLTFTNISKEFTGVYRCFAESIIKKSFPANEEKKQTTTDLTIEVLYQSSVIMFNIIGREQKDDIEVTENEYIIFNCSVDSNPESAILLSLNGKELALDLSARTLLHTHRITSCLDDGVYKCASHNSYNKEPSFRELRLLVRCKPRLSPEFNIRSTVSTLRNKTVTFEFKAMGKPIPVFAWFKLNGSSWKYLNITNKYKIQSSGLYSNLSVKRITGEDYGYYRLKIQNIVGSFEQMYYLQTNGPPEKLHFMISEMGLKGNKFIVNKNEDISFMCFSGTDIPFDIVIRRQDSKQLTLVKNTTSIRHKIEKVSCNDAGIYICSARNTSLSTTQHNAISKLLTLIVECPPAPTSEHEEVDTIFSVLHTDITLQFEVHGFFDEINNTVFMWFKHNDSLPNDGRKYIITSYGFQSNLVIRNIIITDLGQYKILVINSYGQYIQLFELKEKEKSIIESTTTMISLLAVGTFGFVIVAVIFINIRFRHIRRKRIYGRERRHNAEVGANQTTSIEDDNVDDVLYEEINNVYNPLDQQLTEGEHYIEMQSIQSEEDSNKYYITPTHV